MKLAMRPRELKVRIVTSDLPENLLQYEIMRRGPGLGYAHKTQDVDKRTIRRGPAISLATRHVRAERCRA